MWDFKIGPMCDKQVTGKEFVTNQVVVSWDFELNEMLSDVIPKYY